MLAPVLFPADRISLREVADKFGVSIMAPYRWIRTGCNGVILKSFLLGGRRYVTPAALEAFVREIQQNDDVPRTAAAAARGEVTRAR